MTGQKKNDMMGTTIMDVLELSDQDWKKIISNGSGGPFRTDINNLNGQKCQIEYSFTTMLDGQNDAVGSVLVFRNISERVRAEIAEANADRLESIGTLAGGIAHDFNNIMTSVVGELFLLRAEIESSAVSMNKSRERVDEMEIAMNRGKFVAQELLSLSKGGAPIQKPTMLRELVEDTAKLAFTGSSMRWTMECPDDLWAVNIDAGQMNRAFLNILFNAQEASTSTGMVKIIARNIKGAPPGISEGKYVVLDFVDNA